GSNHHDRGAHDHLSPRPEAGRRAVARKGGAVDVRPLPAWILEGGPPRVGHGDRLGLPVFFGLPILAVLALLMLVRRPWVLRCWRRWGRSMHGRYGLGDRERGGGGSPAAGRAGHASTQTSTRCGWAGRGGRLGR